jgi:hypothetical protein
MERADAVTTRWSCQDAIRTCDSTLRFKPYHNDGQTLTHFRDGYTFALGHGQRLQFPTDKQSREKRSERGRSSSERYGVCLIGPPVFKYLVRLEEIICAAMKLALYLKPGEKAQSKSAFTRYGATEIVLYRSQ